MAVGDRTTYGDLEYLEIYNGIVETGGNIGAWSDDIYNYRIIGFVLKVTTGSATSIDITDFDEQVPVGGSLAAARIQQAVTAIPIGAHNTVADGTFRYEWQANGTAAQIANGRHRKVRVTLSANGANADNVTVVLVLERVPSAKK